uniref:CSON006568 protein n=1 Tax=Culicoides sonorensis TaxID=179676 RepID=A0A336MWQ4_CULSO
MSQETHQHQSSGSGGQKQSRNKKSSDKKDKEQQLMHLKVVDRVLKWPVVGTAWNEGNHVYDKIKGLNLIFTKTFELAEMSCHTMVKLSMPLIHVFDTPITVVDNVLDKGLSKLEATAPIVTVPTTEFINTTREMMMVVVQKPLDCATSLLLFSKDKANTILTTSCGTWAVTKIDNFSAGAEKLIDRFCKLSGEGEDLKSSVKTPADKDPVMHVVETVGSLFGIVSRRVLVKFVG